MLNCMECTSRSLTAFNPKIVFASFVFPVFICFYLAVLFTLILKSFKFKLNETYVKVTVEQNSSKYEGLVTYG